MRVFIIGSRGGLGQSIVSLLEQNKIQVVSLSSKEMDLKKLVALDQDTQFDGFIHCAGVNELSPYEKVTRETARPIMEVNTFSFIELCAQINFSQKPNIIAIGSIYSTQTKENRVQYTMAKHALYGAVKTLAIEMAPAKVNLVSPGFVDTALTRKNNTLMRLRELEEKTPLGLTSAQDIAEMCLYLMTKNNCITGQNIIIDSGYSLIGV